MEWGKRPEENGKAWRIYGKKMGYTNKMHGVGIFTIPGSPSDLNDLYGQMRRGIHLFWADFCSI